MDMAASRNNSGSIYTVFLVEVIEGVFSLFKDIIIDS